MQEKERLLERILSLTTDRPWTESIRLSRESVERIGNRVDFSRIKQVYLTGGGTSLYAAEVGKCYMEKIAGIRAEAVPCYYFSHYLPGDILGPDACLVAISQTGTAKSVADSIRVARQAHAVNIAISGYTDKMVPAAASHVIMTDAKTEGPTAKSTSYTQAVIATYVLAIAIGLSNGHLTREKAAWWNGQLERTVEKSAQLPDVLQQVSGLAELYKHAPIHHCMATGPNVGTVQEGALKIIEMAWVPAEGREMEDFLHGRYREVDETTPLLLLAPKGPSKSKLMDTIGSAGHIGAPTIVFTDDDDPVIAKVATHIIRMPGGIDEYLTPMIYITPLWRYAYQVGVLRGSDPAGNRHGFVPTRYDYNEHYDKNGNVIKPVL